MSRTRCSSRFDDSRRTDEKKPVGARPHSRDLVYAMRAPPSRSTHISSAPSIASAAAVDHSGALRGLPDGVTFAADRRHR